MKKLFLMFIMSFFIIAAAPLTAGPLTPELGIYGEPKKGKTVKKEKPEQIKPLSDVLVYCNTRKFVDKMVQEGYRLKLAAKGLVNDDHHNELLESQLWMNPINNQWAIVFVYRDIDRSCVVGGNKIVLRSP
jgi:hypothetical protein